MLNIKIICAGCGKYVEVDSVIVDALDDISIKVFPCKNLKCLDCSECETEQENENLRNALESVQTKHNLLKGLSDYGPCKCTGAQICMLHAALDILLDIEKAVK